MDSYAVKVVRELCDGLRLLLDLVHPVQYLPAEARRTFQCPRRPPPPGPRALVFPGRTPREPIPEHAFRYLLRTMGSPRAPGSVRSGSPSRSPLKAPRMRCFSVSHETNL